MVIHFIFSSILGFAFCEVRAPRECFIEPVSGLEVCTQPVEPVPPAKEA